MRRHDRPAPATPGHATGTREPRREPDAAAELCPNARAAHRAAAMLAALGAAAVGASHASASPGAGAAVFSVKQLFLQSLDGFTWVLLAGSLAAAALVVRCVLDIRTGRILPAESLERMHTLVASRRFGELRTVVEADTGFAGEVLRPALRDAPLGRDAMRESAEIAAGEATARMLRKLDLLSVIGNLGPLVGLAGTVWGMILAFTQLGATEGQAGPAALSGGIAKALFHTLLGLLLAIPCLLVFNVYRAALDRICTRGIAEAWRILERVPAGEAELRNLDEPGAPSRDTGRPGGAETA